MFSFRSRSNFRIRCAVVNTFVGGHVVVIVLGNVVVVVVVLDDGDVGVYDNNDQYRAELIGIAAKS